MDHEVGKGSCGIVYCAKMRGFFFSNIFIAMKSALEISTCIVHIHVSCSIEAAVCWVKDSV